MHKQQSQSMSRIIFQHLTNVTLFVTTGLGRNRGGAGSGRRDEVEEQNGEPSLASSSSTTIAPSGSNNINNINNKNNNREPKKTKKREKK